MKKSILSILFAVIACTCYAQTPLTFTKTINIQGTKEELHKSAQQFFLVAFDSYEDVVNCEDSIVVEGKGSMLFNPVVLYASILGNINYIGRTVIKNGSIIFTMTDFTHVPMKKAAFNNTMGVLVAELPKNLSDIGISGANRKSCYKYYYKVGVIECKQKFDTTFEKLAGVVFK